MLLHRRYGEERRYRHMVFVHAPVGQDEDVRAVLVRAVRFEIEPVDRLFERCIFIIRNRDHCYFKSLYVHGFYF